jgi:hypothetical protein
MGCRFRFASSAGFTPSSSASSREHYEPQLVFRDGGLLVLALSRTGWCASREQER